MLLYYNIIINIIIIIINIIVALHKRRATFLIIIIIIIIIITIIIILLLLLNFITITLANGADFYIISDIFLIFHIMRSFIAIIIIMYTIMHSIKQTKKPTCDLWHMPLEAYKILGTFWTEEILHPLISEL